jgi:hypothetical protein
MFKRVKAKARRVGRVTRVAVSCFSIVLDQKVRSGHATDQKDTATSDEHKVRRYNSSKQTELSRRLS